MRRCNHPLCIRWSARRSAFGDVAKAQSQSAACRGADISRARWERGDVALAVPPSASMASTAAKRGAALGIHGIIFDIHLHLRCLDLVSSPVLSQIKPRPASVHTAWYSPHSDGPASVPRSGARCLRMHAIASCPSSSSTQVTKNRNTCHPNATFTTLRRSGHSAHVESSTSNTQPASSS